MTTAAAVASGGTGPAVPGPGRHRSALRRAVFLLPAALALLAGLDAALMLLGLPAPVSVARLPEVHGMLLVFGFVGTLIALERAVALNRRAGMWLPGDVVLIAGGVLPFLYICWLGVRHRVGGVTLEEPGDVLFTEIGERVPAGARGRER